jgi:hypothetical protein
LLSLFGHWFGNFEGVVANDIRVPEVILPIERDYLVHLVILDIYRTRLELLDHPFLIRESSLFKKTVNIEPKVNIALKEIVLDSISAFACKTIGTCRVVA